MNERDKKEKARFAAAMNWLAERFPMPDQTPRVLDEGELDGYFQALRHLTIAKVEAATKQAFQELRFFPKPVELRDLAKGFRDEQRQLPQQAVPILQPELQAEYRKDADKCLKAMKRDDYSHADKVNMMKAMERAYPGFGWGEEAEALNRHHLRVENQRS